MRSLHCYEFTQIDLLYFSFSRKKSYTSVTKNSFLFEFQYFSMYLGRHLTKTIVKLPTLDADSLCHEISGSFECFYEFG